MSNGNRMNGDPYGGGFDVQGSIFMPQDQNPQGRFDQQQQQQSYDQSSMFQYPMYDAFSVLEEYENPSAKIPMMENCKGEQGRFLASEEDGRTFDVDAQDDGRREGGRGKKDSLWHRMKWTEKIIKLLITVLSYLGEDAVSGFDIGRKRKIAMVQKKGKWKLVSKVMAERGYYVSPQQCEDKFNDLNKRYKRLTDILGRGTSCKVVENPALLEYMPHLSEKAKDDARKILSSKHLFYEEMCSYHNGNRLNLPADPSVERSLQLALKNGDNHDSRKSSQDGVDEDDMGLDAHCDDNQNDTMENSTIDEDIGGICCPKKMRQEFDLDDVSFASSFSGQSHYGRSHIQDISIDVNQKYPEDHPSSQLCMRSRSLQLEEQRLQIEAQLLELEKQRFMWQNFSRKKDRELDKLRLDNEKIRLENEHLTWELKCKEQEISMMQVQR